MEMEEEMGEDEKDGLRGGWEDFVGEYEAAGSSTILSSDSRKGSTQPSKRERSPDGKASETPKTKKPSGTLRFDRDLVREEKMRGLGLRATSSKTDGKVTGSRLVWPITSPQGIKEENVDLVGQAKRVRQPTEDSGQGWACTQCTFINAKDHDRCGESRSHACSSSSSIQALTEDIEMCLACPDGAALRDV